MSVINQKEYLKKYLSLGDEKEKSKKRKKKSKIIKDRVKIIDDDIDVPHNVNEDEMKEFLTAEDAPQVVGIIDDRPLSMRIDDYRKSDKWKLVGSDDELKEKENDLKSKSKQSRHSDSDASPPRRTNKRDHTPPRRDKLLEKKSRSNDTRNDSDSDRSPPRRSRKKSDSVTSPYRRKKRNSDSDVSPPRKIKKEIDSDASPPRKNKLSDSDTSPSRRKRRQSDSDKRNKKQSEFVPNHSPPRKLRKSTPDLSPPRRGSKNFESGNKSKKSRWDVEESNSSFKQNSDSSPPRRKKSSSQEKPKKMLKTLDGKTAGIQNAKELKKETAAFKQRENDLFKNMSAEASGKDAAPILRDRKTGKRRDLEKEAMVEMEKQQVEQEKKQKYDKWGKGLKQVEDHKQKMEEEIHEMQKPLARYADDEDLEKYLKEQEREGDPMLAYIRKKKRKEAEASGIPIDTKPQYQGEFMPNRYGIPPGHRWDGVDRSNGYEKDWFKVQNSKKAVQEDIYKWSTEDM